MKNLFLFITFCFQPGAIGLYILGCGDGRFCQRSFHQANQKAQKVAEGHY